MFGDLVGVGKSVEKSGDFKSWVDHKVGTNDDRRKNISRTS